ncbi:peptidylprolyl isomerase [Falsiroseomonas sp.]|uniref:peptidylprolyl isomerase n=1 Tax=Falsiroseomonas sp. TaxID=2870721 RepID=UPI00271C3A3E|nr:peptidylprolyl isomerase [Falsiroseomonas sp.]MDO9502012.1 peptidylprolyl isomerase [Falsiroseomonas sp.]MDP3415385.1 peptidylprolyl isomerase [Falsiroseomonas sp.]
MRPTARALLLLSTLASAPILTLPATALAQRPAAQPAQVAGQQVNRIVAVINGDIVTQADVEGRRRLFALNAGLNMTPQVLERLTPQVTRLLVDERLRVQEVQRRRIPVTDADLAGAVGELERRNGLPAGALVAQLRRAGVEPRVLYDQLRVQIGWARLVRQLLGPQAEPSEAAVAELIASQRARTGQPEFLVSEIFVPVDDPAEEPEVRAFVDEVVSQLRRGVPFPVAATQFSQAQTALQGGDLGWVGAEALDQEVAEVVRQMPPGAIANPIRVPGGFQIVALRQRREVGRDMATILTLRQAFFPFSGALDPNNPTQQQIQTVERARALSNSARSCEAVDAAARAAGGGRDPDPGEVRLEAVQPPALRQLIGGLQPGRASQPVIAPDGVAVIMVCTRETRNQAELTPDAARAQLLRDRAELLSRQVQRDLRRRAQIEMRS